MRREAGEASVYQGYVFLSIPPEVEVDQGSKGESEPKQRKKSGNRETVIVRALDEL